MFFYVYEDRLIFLVAWTVNTSMFWFKFKHRYTNLLGVKLRKYNLDIEHHDCHRDL